MHGIILFFHILAATIWTGGHLVLAVSILPKVLKESNVAYLSQFESSYEKIGMPALIVQVITGLWLAYNLMPDVLQWFNFSHPVGRLIFIKLVLLLTTMVIAVHARLRIIPNLSARNLKLLAFHVVPVSIISVLFVFVGVSFRTGWLY